MRCRQHVSSRHKRPSASEIANCIASLVCIGSKNGNDKRKRGCFVHRFTVIIRFLGDVIDGTPLTILVSPRGFTVGVIEKFVNERAPGKEAAVVVLAVVVVALRSPTFVSADAKRENK